MPVCACTCPRSSAPQTGAQRLAGFSLIAEDGNPLPGVPRVQSEVFHGCGQDLRRDDQCVRLRRLPCPIFDRELSLSGNSTRRDAGMLAYIGVNGLGLAGWGYWRHCHGQPLMSYSPWLSGQTLTVSDPAKGVIANDVNVFGVKVLDSAAHAPGGYGGHARSFSTRTVRSRIRLDRTSTTDSFTYCGNGAVVWARLYHCELHDSTVGAGC